MGGPPYFANMSGKVYVLYGFPSSPNRVSFCPIRCIGPWQPDTICLIFLQLFSKQWVNPLVTSVLTLAYTKHCLQTNFIFRHTHTLIHSQINIIGESKECIKTKRVVSNLWRKQCTVLGYDKGRDSPCDSVYPAFPSTTPTSIVCLLQSPEKPVSGNVSILKRWSLSLNQSIYTSVTQNLCYSFWEEKQ